MPTQSPPTISNLAEWRKLRTITHTTADGLVLTLRQASVLDLAEQGAIPQSILGTLTGLQGKSEAESQTIAMEHMDALAATINAVVCAMVRRPAVLSLATAQSIVQRVAETYSGEVEEAQVAQWLDDAAQGEDVPELAGPERAFLVQRYTNSLLVTEIPWDDRMAIFTLATSGVGPIAAFPASAS